MAICKLYAEHVLFGLEVAMEAQWLADRTTLRTLLQTHPHWTIRDFAEAIGRSRGWVKKWRRRLRDALPDDDAILRSRSRARHHPPPPLDPRVIDRLLEIRDQPPADLHRIPGPKAILYFLGQDAELRALGLRLPRSTRTVWQILRHYGRIALPGERRHTPVDRPPPMTSWQLDFKDVATVPAEPEGKQQHVVEVLNTVDVGTSILVNAQVRPDFTTETTLQAVVESLRTHGLPESITLDRDPRFVGSPQGRDFPAPLVRLLHCLGVTVTICPPRRPDKNAFVERYNRTFAHECLRVYAPREIATVETVTAAFRQHYNYVRPNQAVTCANRPPCVAFSELPPRPPLPASVDPDRWLTVLDGHRYVRKVRACGTVRVDGVAYYVDQAWAGKYVSLQIDAPNRRFVVEYHEQPIKMLPIKGLVGERLGWEAYLAHMSLAARTNLVVGRPVGQQLRLL
jgi:Integrase core domain